MSLLQQVRADASRLLDEASPEIVSALEHIGTSETVAKLLVALIGTLEQAIPGLVRPEHHDAAHTEPEASSTWTEPAPVIEPQEPLVTKEASSAAVASVSPTSPQTDSAPTDTATVSPQSTQQPTVADLERRLRMEEAKVAALQSASVPQPQPKPAVSGENTTPGGGNQ